MDLQAHWFVVTVSLVAALAFAIVPLPDPVAPFRPDWVALAMIYWMLMAPGRLGLIWAALLGLLLDTLSGALLGQNALALLLVAYICQRFCLRIRVFPISQMTLTVFALLATYQFLLFWVDGVAGRSVPMMNRWGPVLSGAIVWPLILGFLDNLRQEAQARI